MRHLYNDRPSDIRELDPEEVGTGCECESGRHVGQAPEASIRLFFGRLQRLHLCRDCHREAERVA